MISYRMKPIPLNIDGAIYRWRLDGMKTKAMMRKLKPVIEFWLEYPGYGSKFSIAQSAFERRLLAAGYPLDDYRNDPLRVLHVRDEWVEPVEYGRDDKGGRTVTPRKWSDDPIPFQRSPSYWPPCYDEEDETSGYLYLLVPKQKIQYDESLGCSNEGHKAREILMRNERDFLLKNVGICSRTSGLYLGWPATESDYLRYWKRAKLSADDVFMNLQHLLEQRERSPYPGTWWFEDHKLDFPVKIPERAICWGSDYNATDRISSGRYVNG